MAKYKPTNENQMVMLPISLEDQLVEGTLDHTIHRLVEENIDLSVFDKRYKNDECGAKAIHPKILLKVVLLAYARGMIGSRRIERACHENVIFIALSYGHAPDHSTIATFISSMQNEIASIFCDVLLVCEELNLLDGTHFALDGVKLSANVSKEMSGTIEELKHKRDKLQEKLQRVIEEHAQTDQHPERERERQLKRERRFQTQIERLNDFLENAQPKIGSEGKEIQSNAVDNGSAKMATSHGVLQGYNAQALVDSKHQIIVAAEAFASQDHQNLAPMIERAKKNFEEIGKSPDILHGKQLTADSNYHSLNALQTCRDEKLDAYIPDIHFRKRDPRFANQARFKKDDVKKSARFSSSDFYFDEDKQVFICPNGKVLKCHAHGHVNRYRAYDIYHARQQDCDACSLRLRCLSKPTNARRTLSIQVGDALPNLIDEMKAKIDAPEGKKIYAQRLKIVEPVFANICVHKDLDNFTLRSKPKVDVQWSLYAIVSNIGKIHVFGKLN